MKLKGKKALVTGGSSGIGRTIALAYAAQGADVAISYLKNHRAAKQVTENIQARERKCYAIQCDLKHPLSRMKLVDTALHAMGQIDILVNNAGIVYRNDFLEINEEDYDDLMNINLKGLFFITQRVVTDMIKKKIRGSIINISSISDQKAGKDLTLYQISKAGVSRLTESLAYELADHQIRVNTISPGLTTTNINRDQWESNQSLWDERCKRIPLGRAGRPEDYIWAAIYLASEDSEWTTGARFVVDGGSTVS